MHGQGSLTLGWDAGRVRLEVTTRVAPRGHQEPPTLLPWTEGGEYRHVGATVYLARSSTRVITWFDLTPGSEDRRALEALIEQPDLPIVWLPDGRADTLPLDAHERDATRQALALATQDYRAARDAFAARYDRDAEPPTAYRPRTAQRPAAPIPYFAERSGELPPAGEPVVGGVQLPAGNRVGDEPAFWCSYEAVDGIEDVCARLADVFPETGLWPLAWSPHNEDPDRFSGHGDPAEVDALDAATVIAAHWDQTSSHGDRLGLGGPALAAPGTGTPLTSAERFAPLRGRLSLVEQSPLRRLLLVPCNRPADVIAVLAPEIESPVTPAEIAAVLRSWEERFDAVVIEIDELPFTFSVGAPPTTPEQALQLAAEVQVVMPTYDWMRPDGPRNVVHLFLHGTTADPEFPREADISPRLWQLAPNDD